LTTLTGGLSSLIPRQLKTQKEPSIGYWEKIGLLENSERLGEAWGEKGVPSSSGLSRPLPTSGAIPSKSEIPAEEAGLNTTKYFFK